MSSVSTFIGPILKIMYSGILQFSFFTRNISPRCWVCYHHRLWSSWSLSNILKYLPIFHVQVLTDDGVDLATLSSGHVFGEISILEIPGLKTGNKRNANVMSVGYSDCFALSKNDLWSLLKDYPEVWYLLNWVLHGGVTGFLGSLKISPFEERRLKDTQNLKCEDRRFQNCLVLKTEDSATKPTKPEDWRFEFLNGKIQLLSVINWEDGSWWYLPH